MRGYSHDRLHLSLKHPPRRAAHILLVVLVGSQNPTHAGVDPHVNSTENRVILRSSAVVLKVEESPISTRGIHHVFRAQKVEGDWVWHVAGRLKGWAPNGQVNPFDLALPYYSDAIRRHSDAAVTAQDQAIDLLPSDSRDAMAYRERLKLYKAGKPFRLGATVDR